MKVKVHASVGGTDSRQDAKLLQQGVHVVVGTPGRVVDMMKKGVLKTDYVKICVIDEADEMLKKDFRPQIQQMFSYLPSDSQICLFSATFPQDVLDLTSQFMTKPARILVRRQTLTLEGINQYYIACEKTEWKLDILMELYGKLDINQAIIYCNTKKAVVELEKEMKENDFVISVLHGDMDQEERNTIMKQFRQAATRVLITTDLLARGIDVQQVELVINFELPRRKENYLHRIGRAGRFGKKGTAINFVTPHDVGQLKDVQDYYET